MVNFAEICLTFGVTIIHLLVLSSSNVYTSVHKMRSVPVIESRLIGLLEKYLNRVKDDVRKEYTRRFLENVKSENALVMQDPAYVENPINSYKLLRRMTEDWREVIKNLTCHEKCDDADQDLSKEYGSLRREMGVWPEMEDFISSTMALIRLKNTYAIPMDDLKQGIIYDTKTIPLTGLEFSMIGEKAIESEMDYEAIEWYNASVDLYKQDPNVDSTSLVRTMKKLSSTLYREGYPSMALEMIEAALKYDPERPALLRDKEYYNNRVKRLARKESAYIFRRPPHPALPDIFPIYEALCRGQIKSPKELAKLHCRLRKTEIPIIWSKVEYANVNPPVVLFHDVIDENGIKKMKSAAQMKLRRSTLGKLDGSGIHHTEERISETGWLWFQDSEEDKAFVARLIRRINLFTGLDGTSRRVDTFAEPFQVLNYGLGGMYLPHNDYVKVYRDFGYEKGRLLKNAGDRVATWMFYLSDVRAGGATVFPNLKARVPAVKGAAAFWYNMKRNGELDPRHLHAGCPILIGEKWAANKWFRELGQTFKYRCSTNPEE